MILRRQRRQAAEIYLPPAIFQWPLPFDIEPLDMEPLDMDPLLCPCAKAAPANEVLRKSASEVIFMELFIRTLLEVGRIARPSISLL